MDNIQKEEKEKEKGKERKEREGKTSTSGHQDILLVMRDRNNNQLLSLQTHSWPVLETAMEQYYATIGGVENFEGYITVNVKKTAFVVDAKKMEGRGWAQ
jgi:alanyl-tRNA synthetase